METTELNNFYPRSPCGERPMPFSLRFASFNFYPRSPCGERQAVLHVHFFCVTISIHALLAESDDNSRHCSPRNTQNFYPRSPCGERHFTFTADTKQKQFLSTLSLRRATEVVVQRVVESGISIHALLAESDCVENLRHISASGFLSTLSLRRATALARLASGCGCNFYPRSPCGERPAISVHWLKFWYFYPRSPCGERPFLVLSASSCSHFYPRSPCGERQHLPRHRTRQKAISIHALLAESDMERCGIPGIHPTFLSTLSLRRATTPYSSQIYCPLFLSTLSLRRATGFQCWRRKCPLHFYPRSPCGERLRLVAAEEWNVISIHALLAESDMTLFLTVKPISDFYPRSPCGERLFCIILGFPSLPHFYPRSPCGERPHAHRVNADRLEFLSTLSLRRATLCTHAAARGRTISIHALLAESDPGQPGHHRHHSHFYPRSPCGERRRRTAADAFVREFLSTLSLRRATPEGRSGACIPDYFYPRSPCGERLRTVFIGSSTF